MVSSRALGGRWGLVGVEERPRGAGSAVLLALSDSIVALVYMRVR